MDYPKSVPGVGLVGGKFVDENTATGQQGSLIPSAWGNSVTEELLNLIKAAGVVPSEASLDQIAKILWVDPTEAKRGMPMEASSAEVVAGVVKGKMITPYGMSALNATSGSVAYITPGVHTFQVPDVVKNGGKKVRVTVTGGGGSGGGGEASSSRAGGGGGAGGTAIKVLSLLGIASVTVTVGERGIGVNPLGVNGGASSFGGYLSGLGGVGATGALGASGGPGASATGGDINIYGGWGMDGGSGASVLVAGCGGASYWGGGGRSSPLPESHPSAFGGGGGGTTQGGLRGNNATGGAVFIEW